MKTAAFKLQEWFLDELVKRLHEDRSMIGGVLDAVGFVWLLGRAQRRRLSISRLNQNKTEIIEQMSARGSYGPVAHTRH
jgi:hypothetical protein